MKWLKRLFVNDWTVIEVFQGKWTVSYSDSGAYLGEESETSVYEILYSKSLNELKLRLSGYRPREHKAYLRAVRLLNELKEKTKKE